MKPFAKSQKYAASGACWLATLCALYVLVCCSSMPRRTPGEALYQSTEAVVYRLGAATTPEILAERFLGNAGKAWVITDNNPESTFAAGQVVTIPLANENKGGLYANGVQVVPILCYHRFADRCDSNMCIPAETFASQLEYLKQNGYHTISLAQLAEFLAYREAIPAKSVVITMDDGYRSIYDIAYPLLKKYGFTASLFIYTDFVQATSIAMTWDQIAEMKAAGFEIGSHSVSHADLTLKKEAETEAAFQARITRELMESKKIIDRKLNQETVFFAYPYGSFNQSTLRLTQQAGYRLGLGIQNGGNPFFADPHALRRNQILSSDGEYFKKRTQTRQPISLKVSYAD
jgi:peptidoglycan/xylan/chitin deacetylase (PgdA/CDA1 family)